MLIEIIGTVVLILIIVIIFCFYPKKDNKKDSKKEEIKNEELVNLEDPMIEHTDDITKGNKRKKKIKKEEEEDLNNIPKNTITQTIEIKTEIIEESIPNIKSVKKSHYKPVTLKKENLEEENEEQPKYEPGESIPISNEDIVQQEELIEEQEIVVKEEEKEEKEEPEKKDNEINDESKSPLKPYLSKSVADKPEIEPTNEEVPNTPEKEDENKANQSSSKNQKKKRKKNKK